ncbi:hypothetical protein DU53_07205 [Kosmotoga sp. DU53]|nr:hypothetical protein DU53_07205 [Kosmotoga sp. DU53]
MAFNTYKLWGTFHHFQKQYLGEQGNTISRDKSEDYEFATDVEGLERVGLSVGPFVIKHRKIYILKAKKKRKLQIPRF